MDRYIYNEKKIGMIALSFLGFNLLLEIWEIKMMIFIFQNLYFIYLIIKPGLKIKKEEIEVIMLLIVQLINK